MKSLSSLLHPLSKALTWLLLIPVYFYQRYIYTITPNA